MRSFLKYFLILLVFFSIFKLFDNAINRDAWQYGEWLINYQSGFVRRGLIGELIYLVSYIFNQNLQVSFIFVISFIVITYYFLNYQLIKRVEFNNLNILILFSPLFFIFFIIISKIGIKKEIILYIFYVIYLLILLSENYNYKKNWYILLPLPIILLVHEGFVFFLPYFLLPLLFVTDKKNSKILLLQLLYLFISSSMLTFVLYVNKGNSEFTTAICDSLNNFAPEKCTWWGPIAALKTDISLTSAGSYYQGISENEFSKRSGNLFYLFNDLNTYSGFIFYIIYSFIPIIIFFTIKKFIKKKLLIILSIIVFLFSIPLFHVAQDWSRWFSIHFHLIAFLIFFLERNNLIYIKRDDKFNKIHIFLLDKFKYTFLIFVFLYATAFHHHHFFHEGVRLELTYIKVLKKIIK